MFPLPPLRPLSKGVASFRLPALATVHGYSNPLGTISADSCYSVFLRHMTFLRIAGVPQVPKVVAELGPGSSLGVGFAALIAGAEKYYALDLIDFSDPSVNLAYLRQTGCAVQAPRAHTCIRPAQPALPGPRELRLPRLSRPRHRCRVRGAGLSDPP